MKMPENHGIGIVLTLYVVLIASLAAGTRAAEGAARTLNDVNILDAVEKELILDPAVVLNDIDVSVHQGVVTLEGSVDNILSKQRALRVAETVKGVRSVINLIEVDPPMFRSDKAIARDIEEAFYVHSATESFEIHASVKDGVATLRGMVESWQERRLAGLVAKGVRGVIDLKNEITIVQKPDRSDAEIRAEVYHVLKWDALVDHALIEVRVDNGRVTLSGVVGSAAEKTEALIDAHVKGVTSVDGSELEVKLWAREKKLRQDKYAVKSDQAVQKAVEDALLYDPRVAGINIDIRVENGLVTLRGVVENLEEKRAAAQDARNTVGVLRVKNRLRVRPDEPISDRKTEARAKAAIARDPYLEPYQISADVTGGTAVLYGSVNSKFEKAHAEDVISRVIGVQMVDNKLTVDLDREPLVFNPYVDDRDLSGYDWYRPEPLFSRASDAEIKREIEDELWWSPFVDLEDVEVRVEDGRAVLSGEVDSWSEYSAANENALEGGAVRVSNNLRVKAN